MLVVNIIIIIDLTILGAPVLEGRAVDNVLKVKIATLERSIKRLWPTTEPSDPTKHIQRAWNAPVTTAAYNVLMSTSQSPVDLANLKAVVTSHAGDWLHVPALTAVGLRLSEKAIRVAIGYRLGTNICQLHTYVCGATVDARGMHGLGCRKSGPHHIRHSQLNDLIFRAVKKSQISASKEPIALSMADGKMPDGATLVPWIRGKVARLGRDSSRYVRGVTTTTDFNDSLRSSRKVSR